MSIGYIFLRDNIVCRHIIILPFLKERPNSENQQNTYSKYVHLIREENLNNY